MTTIADNLRAVQERLGQAAARAGRDPGAIRLIAVSKKQPAEAVRSAHTAGGCDFGESYAQQLLEKASALPELGLRWHFIGHLQGNKVRGLIDKVWLFHGVDKEALLSEISRRAEAIGARARVLVQVNVAGEASKSGCAPNELGPLLAAADRLPALTVLGLMTLPPIVAKADDARPWFRALVELRERFGGRARLPELSMGMSHDFEVAIEEGATMVRVGTAIFGERR
jgi:pyridoxal phosphate enzyme (YggS family)